VRVLQLGPYPPPHGGVQTNLVAIHRALRARGKTALVANITRHRRQDGDGVYYPRNALQLVWRLLRSRADVIHLHIGGNLSTRLVLLCLVCTLVPRSKSVVTFHSGGYAGSAAGRAARPRTLRGFVLRRVDAIIAVNEEIVQLMRRFGVAAERIAFIAPHAVDPVQIASAAKSPLPESVAAFVRSHRPLLLTVGLLEPEYDLPLQLAALPAVRERFPDAGLAIVGSGSLHEELRGRIAESSVGRHILLCGDVPHDITLGMIANADALLRTTQYDGDSVAVREALCAGTPVIATDNGMRPPGVRLFPVGDMSALVTALDGVLSGSSETASAAGDHGGVEPVLELYDALLSKQSTAALPLADPR
jgi:glycosyltransferase involved in cell wall biosynthesis